MKLHIINPHPVIDQLGPFQKARKSPSLALWIILGVAVLIAIAAFLYHGGVFAPTTTTNTTSSDSTNAATDTNMPTANTSGNATGAIDTTNWLTYESAEFAFGFKYPPGWQFVETPNDKFCRAESNELNGSCTSVLVSVFAQSPSKGTISLSHLGPNPDGLTINKWLRTVQTRNVELEYSFPMGPFEGWSSEEIDGDDYQITASVYFTARHSVFELRWYDGEQEDEVGYDAFVQLLASFVQVE